MAGAPPVSWAGLRVVKAAKELTSGQKLVWLEIWGLANKSPERAYMSAGNIGRRLAMGCDNVEKARRELKRVGLLGSAPRPGRREASWWPTLPANCVPSSERPSDDEVFSLVALLDDQIRRARGGPEADHSTPVPPPERGAARKTEADHSTPEPPRGEGPITPIRVLLPHDPTGVPQSATAATNSGGLQSASDSAGEGGEVGGEGGTSTLLPPPSQEVGRASLTPPPPSAPSSQVGEKAGSFAHERDEKAPGEVGADSNSVSATHDQRDVLVELSTVKPPTETATKLPLPGSRDWIRQQRRVLEQEFMAEQAKAFTAGERR